MGTVWIKELTGGLDVRRLAETTPGGVLIKGNDGHITRGGEFEKRLAFVPAFSLPEGTVGLAATATELVVFGHAAMPVLPTGVGYQRLRHPDGTTALARVLSWDLYDGKIYAVGEFADGSIQHFYDGVRVEGWFDGRARASFRVTGGDATGPSQLASLTVNGVAITAAVDWATSNADTAAAIAAAINAFTSSPEYTATAVGDTVNLVATDAGSGPNGYAIDFGVADGLVLTPATGLVLSGGGSGGGKVATGTITVTAGVASATLRPAIDGVNLCPAVTWAGSVEATATALAASINATTTTPNYTATSNGAVVTVATATRTDTLNGETIDLTFTGMPTVGGAEAVGSFDIAITASSLFVVGTWRPSINGVNLTSGAVSFSSSVDASAAAIAAAINSHTSTPNYTATASGARVTVRTATDTSTVNGKAIVVAVSGSATIKNQVAMAGGETPGDPAAMATSTPLAGGEPDDAFTPGGFVRTIGSKVYSTAGSLLHFSGIQEPTLWDTDTIGAGFINMASENSGSEQLTAVSRYQNLLAVFAPTVVQIWFVDPDPDLNTQSQVLDNTGTSSPQSVTRFGDSDVFYLDESGLRSLRARDSSNSASTTDIGVPIDEPLTAKVASLTDDERRRIIGLINPIDKRFWLIVKDEIYVFSFFSNAKVSAWTTYSASSRVSEETGTLPFDIEEAVVYAKRPYVRAGGLIFAYGGVSGELVYDETEAEAWLPYLDANRPTSKKDWEGVDAALTGLWEISAAMDPTDISTVDVIANVYQTTYAEASIPMAHSSSHLSLRFKSKGPGRAVLSSAVIHYRGGDDEN
jgi:hypothetical protein